MGRARRGDAPRRSPLWPRPSSSTSAPRPGFPFGRYGYTGALRPQVAGVPAIVPLAWFAMALPAREAAHAALGPRSNPATRIVLGAAALTAWDLFLDPQMVGEGYWGWAAGPLPRHPARRTSSAGSSPASA